MFENFPKVRPELPPEFKAIYAAQYKENREGRSTGSNLAQKLESWMHRKIAADVLSGADQKTLEIGAGTLNQLEYEKASRPYDIVEPFAYLYENSPQLERVRRIYSDISDVPEGERYDRITSIAAFEHICELPEVVARAGLMLNEGGVLRVAIPSEGTFLWKLGYTVSTGFEFKRKYGLDYEVLMRHEHVNTAREIEEVLSYFFSEISTSVFGLIKAFSIYQVFICRNPHLVRCEGFVPKSPQ
ncbi:MAG TPA: hypothetical protein PKD26_13000 [Pyrinomonadaceae bacterium]|nr:hypothetical protein [Pyrinomonadaceae bacterium]